MSSNLKVNTILPSVGSNIGIGTNGGELNVDGGCKVQVGTALTLGHSIGLQYATQNLHSAGFEINQINASGIITATQFKGDGSQLTGVVSLANGSDNRVVTATGAAALTGEANLTFDGSTLTVKGASNTTQAVFSGTGGSGSRGLEIVTESVGAADEGVILNARASGTTGRIKLQTNDKTAITILGDGGDVGIGTESPQSAGLTVVNHAETRLQVWANGDGSNGKIALRADGGNTQIGTWSNHDMHIVRNTGIVATVNSNGIAFPSGKGIDFSANTSEGGTSTATLLEDYEEGSYTITSNANLTLDNQRTGYYTKIGNLVNVIGYLSLNTNDGSPAVSGTDNIVLSLPYARDTSTTSYTGTMLQQNIDSDTPTSLVGHPLWYKVLPVDYVCLAASDGLRFYINKIEAAWTRMINSHLHVRYPGYTYIIWNITYRTN